jgi:hypothetical protein
MLKNILAVIAGIFAGSTVVYLLQKINESVFPLPADLDFSDPLIVVKAIGEQPTGALLIIIASHLLGAVVASYIAAKISENNARRQALITGAIFIIAVVTSLTMIPYPIWMYIADVSGAIIGTLLGIFLATGHSNNSVLNT